MWTDSPTTIQLLQSQTTFPHAAMAALKTTMSAEGWTCKRQEVNPPRSQPVLVLAHLGKEVQGVLPTAGCSEGRNSDLAWPPTAGFAAQESTRLMACGRATLQAFGSHRSRWAPKPSLCANNLSQSEGPASMAGGGRKVVDVAIRILTAAQNARHGQNALRGRWAIARTQQQHAVL